MVKKIILLGLGFLPLLLKAQLVLNAQLPAAGFVQKDQLWNLILVNNNADILDVNIQMDLQDAASGQVVLSASTGNLLVGKGVKNISVKDLQPILYNYNVPELSRNYLPMGAYVACYQVMSNIRKDVPLAQECIRFNIDPLSPPLLSTPFDKAEIESPYPQFTWMPPTPYDMFTNLSYDLLVTEVTEGQSAAQAIQYNTPVYNKSDISQPYESYASSFTKLDTGKIYAWQVVAKNGLSYAAKTEVWTFTIRKDSIARIISFAPFIKLSQTGTAVSTAHQGFLKMEVLNTLSDSTGNFTVRNISKGTGGESIVFQMQLPIVTGQNFLQYDMSKYGKLNKNDVYEVEYINSSKKSFFMKFIPVYYR